MKRFLARPDFPNGRSEVLISFEQAPAIIKTIVRLAVALGQMLALTKA